MGLVKHAPKPSRPIVLKEPIWKKDVSTAFLVKGFNKPTFMVGASVTSTEEIHVSRVDGDEEINNL